MRVALDFRMAAHTGIGTYLRNLVRHLPGVAPDLELVVLAPEALPMPPDLPGAVRVLRWPAAPPIHSPRDQWALNRLLADAGEDVDVLHVPHFHAPLFQGPPLVLTLHDLILLHFPEELPHLAARAYARAYFQVVVRRARRIVAVSRFVAEDVTRTLGVDPAKIHVALHGPPEEEAPLPSPGEVRRVCAGLGVEPDGYVLSVGMQRPRKNLARLVRAFARAGLRERGRRLVLAGPPDPRGRAVEEALRETGLEDAVVRPGFVAGEDLPALYAGARLFAFPSLHEGFGFPALEAFRVGTPVLAARASALPEICGEAARYVEPESVGSIAEGLAELDADDALRKRLAREGVRRAGEFSWERCAQETVAAYREAARA